MLIRHDLGLDGIDYVRSYLAANERFGKQFGPLLRGSHDIAAGNAWAFVPAPMPVARQTPLTDFASGGLMRRHAPDWEARVGDWVASMSTPGPLWLWAEDALARPGDSFLAGLDEPVVFCAGSVVYYRDVSSNDPAHELLGGAEWDPDIAIFAPAPPVLPNDRATISHDALARLVGDAIAFGIGAWDDEGVVFWEPHRTS